MDTHEGIGHNGVAIQRADREANHSGGCGRGRFDQRTQHSGADSSYGFFAPAVGAPHQARFLLKDDSGSTWWDTFDQAGNSEARLRLTGIVDGAFMSGDVDEFPQWRKRLVSSWAATMFTRHPSAVSLTVTVEAYVVPSMDAPCRAALEDYPIDGAAQVHQGKSGVRGQRLTIITV